MSEQKDRQVRTPGIAGDGLPGNALVPYGPHDAPSRDEGGAPETGSPWDRVYPGLIWCAVGGAGSALIPLLAALAVAFGASLATAGKGAREALEALAVTFVPCVAVGLLTGANMPNAVVPCAVAWTMGVLLTSGHLTDNALCLLGVGSGAALMAVDAVLCALAGTTLAANVQTYLDAVISAYAQGVANTVAVQAGLGSVRDFVQDYWPSLYLIAGALYAVGAYCGILVFARSYDVDSAYRRPLRDFGAPFWAALVFAAGIAVTMASRSGVTMPDVATLVADNAFQACRVILALDGIAVVVWFLARGHVGMLGQVLAVIVSVQLEYALMVASIVGFVDVIGNFRSLVSDRSPKEHEPTE